MQNNLKRDGDQLNSIALWSSGFVVRDPSGHHAEVIGPRRDLGAGECRLPRYNRLK
jgi:hypothetical protein